MKYSTFLKQVAECVHPLDRRYENVHPIYKVYKQPWICNIIQHDYFCQYPEYTQKLKATIERKLKRSRDLSSLTYFFQDKGISPIKGRVDWLHTLAAIHESKGN